MGETAVQENPLATERIGKLIAKFAIPAIISMLVSSLYNIVDQIFIGQGGGDGWEMRLRISRFRYLSSARQQRFCLELGVRQTIIWNPGQGIVKRPARL